MASLGVRFAALALICCSALAAGCADPQYPAAQTASAVVVGTDRYWVVGRYGFAAEGRGAHLSRADFPETSRTPDWAWESMSSDPPGGHVVELSGRVYLLTMGSEVFRRDPTGWFPLETHFSTNDNPPGEDQAQINDVLMTPDGNALVHVHATQLYWVDADGLERGVMKREALPQFYTWLGFVHGKLYGIGWHGDDRAVFRRESATKWTEVLVAPKGGGEPTAVLPLDDLPGVDRPADDAQIAVVIAGIVRAVEPGGGLRTIPLAQLMGRPPRRLVVAGDDVPVAASEDPHTPATPSPPSRTQPSQAQPSQAQPSQTQPSQAQPSQAQPSQAISPPIPPPPPPPKSTDAEVAAEPREPRGTVQNVIRVGVGRYALVIGEGYSDSETLLLLGRGGRRVVSCDILRVRRSIGVIEGSNGTVYVPTDRASVVEIRADGACGEPQVPLLPDE